SPAEKHSFSDFPKGNNQIFALRRQILLGQNLRAIHDRPYGQPFSTRSGGGSAPTLQGPS
ncbi:MAG: hypothetical protein IJX04_08910, partial [Oscillospiraceae bacterium]|nr:hypothetical protein [Oscillospiraceae bacterium]